MNLIQSMNGMMRVEMTTADIPDSLSAVQKAGISAWDVVQTGGLSAELTISRRDAPRFREILERRGGKVETVKRMGLFWTAKAMEKRPVLMLGVAALLALALFLPTRVLFIRVEGNDTVPTRLILEKAGESGVAFGASRRKIRSESVKNGLLGSIPELQWAGVNTAGCVATISVRERTETEPDSPEYQVCSIVACRDAVIRSCTVTRGNALCKVGQAVKAGEVLVSGYTDCGLSIRATRAEGEIFGETKRCLEVVTPEIYRVPGEITRREKKYAILLGKKRINLWKDSGISTPTCVKMYSENYVTLPGGFRLPLAIATEERIYYDWTDVRDSREAVQERLTAFAECYLKGQMAAGRILSREEQLFPMDGAVSLEGEYACLEMIGQVRREEFMGGNGESSGTDRERGTG